MALEYVIITIAMVNKMVYLSRFIRPSFLCYNTSPDVFIEICLHTARYSRVFFLQKKPCPNFGHATAFAASQPLVVWACVSGACDLAHAVPACQLHCWG